jgi:glyoxylate carboligase
MIGREFKHFLSKLRQNDKYTIQRPHKRFKPMITKIQRIYENVDDAFNVLNLSTTCIQNIIHTQQVQFEHMLHIYQNNFWIASKFILLSRIIAMLYRISNNERDVVANYIIILFTIILVSSKIEN